MIEQSGCLMTGPRDRISRDAAGATRSSRCLENLILQGRIFQEGLVIVNLISSVEASKMRPVVARTCPPCDIVEAHEDFLAGEHSGKFTPVTQLITP